MMKRVSGTLALSLLLSGPVLACDYPQDSIGDNIPRGATASAQEMETAQRRVASYVKALEAYAACVDGEPAARRQAMLRERNRAVEEAEAVADRINKEIRQYNRSLQLRQASN
jgi:hypothetical protein